MAERYERDMDPEEVEAEEEEEEDVFDSSSQGSSDQTSTLTWINWFTTVPGHDYFCEVLDDFIEDDFNLTGLQSMVPFWKEALEMVLDVEPEEDSSKIPDVTIVESSAELLYGLVHQRFILTKAGLSAMLDKYENGHFGSCPRVYCRWTHVLPVGRSDMPGIDTVKLYCPNCGDLYTPPSSKYSNVDGAFFGTTFAPLFFQNYPELLSAPFAHPGDQSHMDQDVDSDSVSSSVEPPSTSQPHNPNPHGGQRKALQGIYIPRIYGFKVSERAKSGPRMRWLRDRPWTYKDLDLFDPVTGTWRESGKRPGAPYEPTPGGESIRPKTGTLFDDDDEDLDEDEEEEEDDDGGAALGSARSATTPATPSSSAVRGEALPNEIVTVVPVGAPTSPRSSVRR